MIHNALRRTRRHLTFIIDAPCHLPSIVLLELHPSPITPEKSLATDHPRNKEGCVSCDQGRSHEFVLEWGKRVGSVTSGVHIGTEPPVGSGAKPPETRKAGFVCIMIFSKISKYRKYQKYHDIFDMYQIFSIFSIFLKVSLSRGYRTVKQVIEPC